MKSLWKDTAAKVSMGFLLMLVVVIYVAANILPAAINTWVGNGTVISTSVAGGALNTLWVTVGGIVLVVTVILAFLKAR